MRGVRIFTVITGVTIGALLVGTAMASVRRMATSDSFDPFVGTTSPVTDPTSPVGVEAPTLEQAAVVSVPVRPPFRPPIRTPFTP